MIEITRRKVLVQLLLNRCFLCLGILVAAACVLCRLIDIVWHRRICRRDLPLRLRLMKDLLLGRLVAVLSDHLGLWLDHMLCKSD